MTRTKKPDSTLVEYVVPDCEKCDDDGFYFDDRCSKDTCAHGSRTLSVGERKRMKDRAGKDVKVPFRTERAMECPPRPCACPAGALPRARLRDRIRKQEEHFRNVPQEAYR